MNIDYRKLCLELFGTDDVDKLKEISTKLKFNRNAGRKRKLNNEDILKIDELLEKGETINSIAHKMGTTRQLISKYVNRPPSDSCTMRITYMYRQYPCTTIDVDFFNKKIYIKNKTDDIFRRAFGVLEKPSWNDFEMFLSDRCFPETRGNKKEILKDLNIDSYDTLQIAEKTVGRMSDDDMWLKFKRYSKGGILNGNY